MLLAFRVAGVSQETTKNPDSSGLVILAPSSGPSLIALPVVVVVLRGLTNVAEEICGSGFMENLASLMTRDVASMRAFKRDEVSFMSFSKESSRSIELDGRVSFSSDKIFKQKITISISITNGFIHYHRLMTHLCNERQLQQH